MKLIMLIMLDDFGYDNSETSHGRNSISSGSLFPRQDLCPGLIMLEDSVPIEGLDYNNVPESSRLKGRS
jgi:hypothetical protein